MRFSDSIAPRALPLLAFALAADAFWRMPCLARTGLVRLDPLVSNGTISEHAHAVHGGSGEFPLLSQTAFLLFYAGAW
jgi:hypothetical protein